jgi:hypothetical protein
VAEGWYLFKAFSILSCNLPKYGGNITTIKYTYDALGNRISQLVISATEDPKYTWFVRDAQGNLLSTYTAEGDEIDLEDLDLEQGDVFMYGSSRLGSMAVNEGVDDGPGPCNITMVKSGVTGGISNMS